MTHEESQVPGLSGLRRDIAPPTDLWPGIEARIRPRRASLRPWAGLALAASLLVAIVIPLRQQMPVPVIPGTALPGAEQRANYFAAQFHELEGAQRELLLALKLRPQSPALRRLLDSTRQHQRDLRRLAIGHFSNV